MAHHRRKRSRLHATRKARWSFFERRLASSGQTFHAGRRGWRLYEYASPARWDLMKHTRPTRRACRRLERAVETGVLDPDAALWPLGNRKPHRDWD